jgi:DNA-binding protein H-NS
MTRLNLHALSVDELIALDATVLRLIQTTKRDLEAKLALIDSHVAEPPRKRGVKKGTKLAAKYMGPNGETWSGRGMQPKWLTALIGQGHRPDEFLVHGQN